MDNKVYLEKLTDFNNFYINEENKEFFLCNNGINTFELSTEDVPIEEYIDALLGTEEGKEPVKSLMLTITFEDEESKTIYFCKYTRDFNMDIKEIIKNIYREDVNWRNSRIKRFKSGFMSNKVRSLNTAMKNNNEKRIKQINEDIVVEYRYCENLKNQVCTYKKFISLIYEFMNTNN